MLTVGSFLLTVEQSYFQLTLLASLLTAGAFLLTVLASLPTVRAFLLTVGKCRLIRALRGLTVSKKTPTVSKKASPFLFANFSYGNARIFLTQLRLENSHLTKTAQKIAIGRPPDCSSNLCPPKTFATHMIFWGVFWAFYTRNNRKKAQNPP